MMKAVVVKPDGSVILRNDFEVPQRRLNEALIRILRAGICNTDLEIINKLVPGYDGVLGHEFVGVIEEIEEDNAKGLRTSQTVVGEINLVCGTCAVCQLGGIPKRNHCPKRTVLGIINKNGTFAEYITLPVDNLFAVPQSVPDEEAAFAEPLAAAFRIVEQVQTTNADSIAIIGDGKLGNLIAQVLSNQPHLKLTLFGKHESKLEKVLQQNITKILVDSRTSGMYENLFDLCVEASGTPNGLIMAGKITRPLGTVVLKSTCAARISEFDTASFVVKELSIIGSRCGNFAMALEALKNKSVKVDHLIDKVYPIDEALQAIQSAKIKGAMKIQLVV